MKTRAQKTSASSKGATRQVLTGVAMAAMLCAVGILHVASRVAAVESGYALGRLQEAHQTLERENVNLRLQRATLRSAAHIEATARTELGMSTPLPQRVFRVGGPLSQISISSPPPRARGAVALLDRR